jgi:hypothetical protein
VSYSLRACGVAIVTSTVEEDGKLSGNRLLGDVGVVAENGVSADLLDEPIKCVRVNTDLVSVLVNVTLTPELEEVDLSGLLDFGVVLQNP